jgi:hypothetical protein
MRVRYKQVEQAISHYTTSIDRELAIFFSDDITLLYPALSLSGMPEKLNDEVLEYLVQRVEETGVGPSMTFTISGLVVVGRLVRSSMYYDHLSRWFDTYTEKSEGETRKHEFLVDTKDPIELGTLEKYSKDWKQFMIKLRQKKDQDIGRPTYIHLQNVEVWEIFSTEPFRFEYWRGKLSSIDGFTLGTRGQSETKMLSASDQPPSNT